MLLLASASHPLASLTSLTPIIPIRPSAVVVVVVDVVVTATDLPTCYGAAVGCSPFPTLSQISSTSISLSLYPTSLPLYLHTYLRYLAYLPLVS